MRFRHISILATFLLALLLLLLTDPDSAMITDMAFGATAVRSITSIFAVFLYLGVLHIGRKTLADYVDLEVLYTKCLESPVGSGLFVIGIGFIYLSIAVVALAAMLKF